MKKSVKAEKAAQVKAQLVQLVRAGASVQVQTDLIRASFLKGIVEVEECLAVIRATRKQMREESK